MDRVVFNVRRAGVCYAAYVAKVLRRWHFTHARVDIFVIHAHVAARQGVVYQSEIRAHLGCARRTMSVMMQRLEARGMISRTRSEEDRRKIVVEITPLGRHAFADVVALFGKELLTPFVNAYLQFHELKTPVPVQRTRFLGYLATVRTQFGDFVTGGPYPP